MNLNDDPSPMMNEGAMPLAPTTASVAEKPRARKEEGTVRDNARSVPYLTNKRGRGDPKKKRRKEGIECSRKGVSIRCIGTGGIWT